MALSKAEKRLLDIVAGQSKKRKKKNSPRVRAAVKAAKKKRSKSKPPKGAKPSPFRDKRNQEELLGLKR